MSWSDVPCKIAEGPRDQDGYVWLGRKGKAHRQAYIEAYGSIPADRPNVLHHCDNPPCIEPTHLWAGTLGDNTQDMIRKGRSRFGGKNFTLEQVRQVRARVAAGETQRAIARSLGVHPTTVNNLVRGRSWKGVV